MQAFMAIVIIKILGIGGGFVIVGLLLDNQNLKLKHAREAASLDEKRKRLRKDLQFSVWKTIFPLNTCGRKYAG